MVLEEGLGLIALAQPVVAGPGAPAGMVNECRLLLPDTMLLRPREATRGSICRSQGPGARVQGGRLQGFGFRVQGEHLQGLGFRGQGSEFRVQGSGFRVQGSGFRV